MWFGLPNARTTRFSARPRWIGTARRSYGWEDCALSLSILEASDKGKIIIDFLSADFCVTELQVSRFTLNPAL